MTAVMVSAFGGYVEPHCRAADGEGRFKAKDNQGRTALWPPSNGDRAVVDALGAPAPDATAADYGRRHP